MKKKNQHYVPKFYLRNFSNDGRNISLYNYNNGKLISLASIRDQACSDYFYGQDEVLEDFFSMIEGPTAEHLRNIIEENALPKYHTREYYHLLLFMMTLELRTPNAIDEMHEHLNKSLELFAEYDERLSIFKEGKHRIELTDPVASLLGLLEKHFHYVTDLRIKVIVNDTKLPFITSDAPIVKYNEFLEERDYQYGFDGYGGKGLQIFLPISPLLTLLFYDSWVYKVSGKRVEFVKTNNLNDIKKINLLQAIYSRNQLFFNESHDENEIYDTVELSKKYRELKKIEYKEVGNVESSNKKLSKQFSFGIKPIKVKPNFTFTRLTKNAKKYKFNDYAIQLRDESKRYLPEDYSYNNQ